MGRLALMLYVPQKTTWLLVSVNSPRRFISCFSIQFSRMNWSGEDEDEEDVSCGWSRSSARAECCEEGGGGGVEGSSGGRVGAAQGPS